jgi:hypothetical protein
MERLKSMTVTFLQGGEPGSVGSQVVIEGDCRRVSALRPAGGTGEVAQRADYDGRLFAMRRPLRAHIGRGDAVSVGAIAAQQPKFDDGFS